MSAGCHFPAIFLQKKSGDPRLREPVSLACSGRAGTACQEQQQGKSRCRNACHPVPRDFQHKEQRRSSRINSAFDMAAKTPKAFRPHTKRQGVVFHGNHHHRIHRLRGADTKSFGGRGAADIPRPEHRLVQCALGRSLGFHIGPDLAVFGEDIGVPQRRRLGAVVVGGMGGGVVGVVASRPVQSLRVAALRGGRAQFGADARDAVERGDGDSADAVVGIGLGELGCLREHLHPGAQQVLADGFVLVPGHIALAAVVPGPLEEGLAEGVALRQVLDEAGVGAELGACLVHARQVLLIAALGTLLAPGRGARLMVRPEGLKVDELAAVLVHRQPKGVLLQLALVLAAARAEVHASLEPDLVEQPEGRVGAEDAGGVELAQVGTRDGLLLHHGPGALLLELADDRGQRQVGAAQLGVLGEVERAAVRGLVEVAVEGAADADERRLAVELAALGAGLGVEGAQHAAQRPLVHGLEVRALRLLAQAEAILSENEASLSGMYSAP
ncbi:uncharacterized protein LOC115277420 [Suricata suricatta]|uniref:uncharacterized protein LOC115277420 n=1 Tax=Suricata suricatta TaxID=37032 RepID=UPI0011552EFA|nr:uncharacterized protein LOC115277420 [Suricata suricatta]